MTSSAPLAFYLDERVIYITRHKLDHFNYEYPNAVRRRAAKGQLNHADSCV